MRVRMVRILMLMCMTTGMSRCRHHPYSQHGLSSGRRYGLLKRVSLWLSLVYVLRFCLRGRVTSSFHAPSPVMRS